MKAQIKQIFQVDRKFFRVTDCLIGINYCMFGPNIVHADKLLKSALECYWNEMSRDGAWHFCHKSEDIRSFGAPSKTVQKHLDVKVKLPFMAE